MSETVKGDTNLFRAPEGPNSGGDIVSTTALLLNLAQDFGRQHLGAEVEVDLNRFKNNSQLDGVGHSANVRLDFATLERVSGEVVLQSSQTPYLNQGGTTVFTGSNDITSSLAYVNVRIGTVTRLTMEGGVAVSESRYSAQSFSNQDVQQASANLGVRYTSKPGSSARLGLRQTVGRYPDYSVTGADNFHRTDLELTTTHETGGKSAIDTRLAFGHESHSQRLPLSTNEWTGAIRWAWKVTGHLDLTTQFSRDSSAGATSFTTPLVDVQNGNTLRTTALDVGAKWAPTVKVSAALDLTLSHRQLSNAFNLTDNAVAQGSDTTSKIALMLHYQPTRLSDLSCGVAREQRSVGVASRDVSYPYNATTATCSGQIQFR